MNRKLAVLLATFVTLTFSACRNAEVENIEQPTEPAVTEEKTQEPVAETTENVPETPTPEETPAEEANPLEEAPEFKLTQEEEALYNEYIENQDVSIFKDVKQNSIAKIYVKCGIDGNFDAEFKMYAPSTLNGMTYDNYMAEYANGGEGTAEQRQTYANYFFYSIDTGAFVDNGDGTGYIPSKTFEGDDMMFNMVQENGIWLVDYAKVLTPAS